MAEPVALKSHLTSGQPAPWPTLRSPTLPSPTLKDPRALDATNLRLNAPIDAAKTCSTHQGLAAITAILLNRYLKFDPADPDWQDRDRLILSPDHHASLLPGHSDPALIGHATHVRGGAIAVAARHQCLATVVGMALAERSLANRFGRSLVDHRTWAIAPAAELMQPASLEALALAGELALEKLTLLITASPPDQTPTAGRTEHQCRYLASLGWAIKSANPADLPELDAALSFALRTRKPTLIACKPGPIGEPSINNEALLAPSSRGGPTTRRAWLKRMARHNLRTEFTRVIAGRLPDAWHEAILALKYDIAREQPTCTPRWFTDTIIKGLAATVPEMLASPPGADPSGIATCINGLALHGGIIAHAGTSLSSIDIFLPIIRASALARRRAIFVLGNEEDDGPIVEQLTSLRAIPGLDLFRPADALEAAESWELALRRADNPSVIVLSPTPLPPIRDSAAENRCARGGYVLAEPIAPRNATLIASGAEIAPAVDASQRLASIGIAAAVVSLPCWQRFAAQDATYRAGVLGHAPRIGIEAGSDFGWERWLGEHAFFIGPSASAHPAQPYPGPAMIDPAVIASTVKRRLLAEHKAAEHKATGR